MTTAHETASWSATRASTTSVATIAGSHRRPHLHRRAPGRARSDVALVADHRRRWAKASPRPNGARPTAAGFPSPSPTPPQPARQRPSARAGAARRQSPSGCGPGSRRGSSLTRQVVQPGDLPHRVPAPGPSLFVQLRRHRLRRRRRRKCRHPFIRLQRVRRLIRRRPPHRNSPSATGPSPTSLRRAQALRGRPAARHHRRADVSLAAPDDDRPGRARSSSAGPRHKAVEAHFAAEPLAPLP